jgi:HEPN domain-containing protein
MELIKEFLKMANKDLKSSKLLYEHHLYPQAMFLFSQSVEKANKAFALSTGKYTEEDMLDIRHDSTKIYKDGIIETKRRYQNLSRNLEELPDLKNTQFIANLDIQDKINECNIALKQLGEIQNGKSDLVFMSTKEISGTLEEIESNDREIKDELSSIENFELTEQMWEEQKEEMITQLSNPNNNELSNHIEEELTNSNLTHQKIEDLIKHMYLVMFYLIGISHPLYHLAVITLPHSVITRYPQNELFPTKIYTRRLAVVRNLPHLFHVQSKALKNLEEFCRKYVFDQPEYI